MNSLIAQRLAELKAEGVAPVAAIKAVHMEFNLSLAAAKQAFAESPAWANEAASGAQLHKEVITMLSRSQ